MSWYFSFGHGHKHPILDMALGGYAVAAPRELGYLDARAWMIARFGIEWCAQYDSVLDGPSIGYEWLTADEIPNACACVDCSPCVVGNHHDGCRSMPPLALLS